jgi:hypothetical protein
MTLTITEFARMGGLATARAGTRKDNPKVQAAARKANKARWAGHVKARPKKKRKVKR